jgi:putative transcriptional regulator
MKNRIRLERAVLDVSQAELGSMVQVSRQTINAIEGGEYNPSAILTLKLASVINKHVTDLFELEESDWDCD